MNFTLDNHLKYTIDNKLWAHRRTVYEHYKVSVGQVDQDRYNNTNWLSEQYRTAVLVYREFKDDLVVFCSGGTDSEIVLRSFVKCGIKPQAVFIKFTGDYNLEDLKYATQICNELDVDLTVVEFDIKDYYYSGQAAEFSKLLQCRQMAYLTVYHHILKLGRPAVMGGEMLLRRHVDSTGSRWFYCFREDEDASAMRFSLLYNIPLVNEWFSYTPEMIAHYLEHPIISNLISYRENYKMSSVSSKNTVLSDYVKEVIPKVKTHGFEKLLGFNGESYQQLRMLYPKRLEPSLDGIFIHDLKQQLFGEQQCQ